MYLFALQVYLFFVVRRERTLNEKQYKLKLFLYVRVVSKFRLRHAYARTHAHTHTLGMNIIRKWILGIPDFTYKKTHSFADLERTARALAASWRCRTLLPEPPPPSPQTIITNGVHTLRALTRCLNAVRWINMTASVCMCMCPLIYSL